jgi:hypothetical protein
VLQAVGVHSSIRSKGCVTQLELVVLQLQLLQVHTDAPPVHAHEGAALVQLAGYSDAMFETSAHGEGCCSIESAPTRLVT